MAQLIVYNRKTGEIIDVQRTNRIHDRTAVKKAIYDKFLAANEHARSILIGDAVSPASHQVLVNDHGIAVVRHDERALGPLQKPPLTLGENPQPPLVMPVPRSRDVTNVHLLGGITIVVPISGKWHCFSSLLRFLQNCDLPPCPVSLWVNDNSHDDRMGDVLRRFTMAAGTRFQAVSYYLDKSPHRQRHEAAYRTSEIYQRAAGNCLTSMLLTLEDDVIPPTNAIPLMAERLAKAPPQIGAVAALVCDRDGGEPMAWKGGAFVHASPGDVCDWVSFSFTLHRTLILKSAGFTPSTPDLQGAPMTDIALWTRLNAADIRPLVAWDIPCKHMGDGSVVRSRPGVAYKYPRENETPAEAMTIVDRSWVYKAPKPLTEKTILVERTRGLGDMIMVCASLEMLKERRPELSIVYRVQNGTEDLFRLFPFIREVIPEKAPAPKCVHDVVSLEWYSETHPDRTAIDRVRLFGKPFGLDMLLPGWLPRLTIPPEAVEAAQAKFGLSKPWFVIAPISADIYRTLPEPLSREILALAPGNWIQIGPAGRKSLNLDMAKNLVGKTTLMEMAALIAGAAGIVSADTGVAHVAESVGTPGLVLGGHMRPGIRYTHYRHIRRLYSWYPCVDAIPECYGTCQAALDFACLKKIDSKRVATELEGMTCQERPQS